MYHALSARPLFFPQSIYFPAQEGGLWGVIQLGRFEKTAEMEFDDGRARSYKGTEHIQENDTADHGFPGGFKDPEPTGRKDYGTEYH
jgi:hypothetical protein